MARLHLRLPAKISNVQSLDACGLSRGDLHLFSKIVVDFRNVERFAPLASLYLAEVFRGIRRKNPEAEIIADHIGENESTFAGYAHHVGLLYHFGFESYFPKSARRPRHRYFPVTTWNIADIRSEDDSTPVGQIVDEKAKELTEVLLQRDRGHVFDALQYSIREIARNCVEHSKGSVVTLFGQYWEGSGIAEIAIFDDGVGIAENLYENEYIDISTNLAAIKCALLPGITGVALRDRIFQHDFWHNSGFGLWTTSRICAQYGKFHVLSQSDHFFLSGRNQYERKCNLDGTGIGMSIDTRKLYGFGDFHKKVVEEGERQRSILMKEYPVRASTASKMLRSHFDTKA